MTDDEIICPACEGCGMFTLARQDGKILARCMSCGEAIEMAVVRCCDLHGSNCEPKEPCCRYCTVAGGPVPPGVPCLPCSRTFADGRERIVRAEFAWIMADGHETPLCGRCCAGWRANAEGEPNFRPAQVRRL